MHSYHLSHCSKIRLILVFFILVLCYLVISIKLIDLSVFSHIKPIHEKNSKLLNRATILDRNNIVLASNISTASLYAHPKQIADIQGTYKKLSKILGDCIYLKAKLNSKKDFVWIKKHLSPQNQQKVHDLGIPGLHLMPDQRRLYPNANLFSHVIGYVDIDNKGLAGIEHSFDKRLGKHPNDPVKLSLDAGVQTIVHSQLQQAIKKNEAIGGSCVVMDITNGQIISMVSLPDFNPNIVQNSQNPSLFNSTTLGVYEMGSIFKILTIAMALDSNIINIHDTFDISKNIKLDKFTVKDYGSRIGLLSVPEILMYSSNLGTIQIAQKVGIKKQKEYLEKLGLLSSLQLEIKGVGKPLYPKNSKWNDIYLATISYGHGIAVTHLHVVKAIATLVNNGKEVIPTLLLNNSVKKHHNTVFQNHTSDIMKKMLYLVVTKGSGKRANIPHYMVGGKTGTSEKIQTTGGYNKNSNLSFFLGCFPMNKPRYIIFISIDAAKRNNFNLYSTTGGRIAAPIAKSIIQNIATILNITPQPLNEQILEKMSLDYLPDL